MKEGWTYKRFDEVFDLQMGKTPSRENTSYWGGENVWISIADIKDKYIGTSKENITDTAVSESGIKKIPKNTVIMSFKLSVGRSAITLKELYTNEAIMAFTPKEGYKLLSDFIYYYLQGYKWNGANKAVMGMTLNKKSISINTFAFPDFSIQQQIVSELDLLSGVIEKQKAQIEELDKLAQSIFYDMFGDPVSNEKGWEVKKIKDTCNVITGNTPSRNNPVFYNNNYIEWIKTDNIEKDTLYPSQAKEYLSKEGMNQGRVVDAGSILIACIAGSLASIGKCCILDRKVSFNQQINAIVPLKDLNSLFAYGLINAISDYIRDHATNGMKHIISKSVLEEIEIPLPPLALQQEFAAKIEAIESMKAKVRQSLKESEQLFNSRMDYYFN